MSLAMESPMRELCEIGRDYALARARGNALGQQAWRRMFDLVASTRLPAPGRSGALLQFVEACADLPAGALVELVPDLARAAPGADMAGFLRGLLSARPDLEPGARARARRLGDIARRWFLGGEHEAELAQLFWRELAGAHESREFVLGMLSEEIPSFMVPPKEAK